MRNDNLDSYFARLIEIPLSLLNFGNFCLFSVLNPFFFAHRRIPLDLTVNHLIKLDFISFLFTELSVTTSVSV